jgi:hypothetical protein
MSYDLTIAYRIYPKISKTPKYYSDNKLKLSELWIKSLKLWLWNIKAKIIVLLDNCWEEYKNLFLKYFDRNDLVFKEYNWVGNLATFWEQINLLLEQNYSENIYFAEDDYLYTPNCFDVAIKCLNNKKEKVDFISLYDHIDNYELDFQKIKSNIIYIDKQHFRSNSSTCLTFLTTKKTLERTKRIFLSYCKGNYDYSLWITLTKYNIYKPFKKWHFWYFLRTRYYCTRYMLFCKKYKLYTPIPSLATHLESTWISPVVDWDSLFNSLRIDE